MLTPEEIQYPEFTGQKTQPTPEESSPSAVPSESYVVSAAEVDKPSTQPGPEPGHIVVPENTKGSSSRRLFAQYLRGARKITVNDPYVRKFFQIRNMMEFLEMVHELVPEGDEVEVHLVTKSDPETCQNQDETLITW